MMKETENIHTERSRSIPELRFPEFEGEWQKRKLKPLVCERNEYPQSALPLYSLTIENGIVPKSKRYERSFLVNDEKSAYKVIHQHDFAFNPMNLRFGALAKHKENQKVTVSKYYNIFYFNSKADSSFMELFLTSYNMIQFYNKMATGSLEEKKRVHYLDFIEFKLRIPTLPEQQKIASFLTAVDDKITQLSKKKELLEAYKKGVMQRIFPSASSGTPKLRFKIKNQAGELVEPPEWEERKLGEVIEFFNTNSYSRSLLNYNNGSVKNIHYGDIHTKFKSNFDITQENVPYINENVDLSKIKCEQYCQIGDLIIADASEDYKDIGKAIEIVNLNDEKVVAGLHTYIARDKEQVAIGFKGYLFRSEYIRKQIMKLATGVSVLGISKGNLASMSIFIPCLEEQQKIASFLTSIDQKIEQVNTQLEKAKIWKKGLLQKMFV